MSENKSRPDEFYIGYQPEALPTFVRKIRQFLLLLILLIPILAYVLVTNQKGFPNSTFELGQFTEVEGVLNLSPVPMLKVYAGKSLDGKTIIQSILLIGFGKFGAEPTLEKMEAASGQRLVGKMLKLEGTLIYYDGKTLLELTRGEDALKAVSETQARQPAQNVLGTVKLKGEIADPKCFFGVMKPGEGKAHRSCAIRCISGGIPPILKATNQTGEQNYFLLTDMAGNKINAKFLHKIGMAWEVMGELVQQDDWLILKVDPENGIERTHPELLGQIQMCQESQLARNF